MKVFCVFKRLVVAAVCLSLVSGCGIKQPEDEEENSDTNGAVGVGGNGDDLYYADAFVLDLYGSKGLGIESESKAGLALSPGDEVANLIKLGEARKILPALKRGIPDGLSAIEDTGADMPRVIAIGISPTDDVYVLFEHTFVYRYVAGEAEPWSSSSEASCQLFHLKSSLTEALTTKVADGARSNLECVTHIHEVPTWRNEKVMQFDSFGNLYFPAHVPGSWKDVYYKYNPSNKELTEVVNGNIWWDYVKVGPQGEVYYTGTTSADGNQGGVGFFRYISPENNLTEIASNWWNFIFVENHLNVENDGLIRFYGPDPEGSNSYSWDTACVWSYDPLAAVGSRANKIARCINNIWNWLNESGVSDAVKQARCESTDLHLSGDGIKKLLQMSNGDVLVSGTLNKKHAGTWMGSYCDMGNGDWQTPITGLALLKSADELTLISDADEAVQRIWVTGKGANEKIIFSSKKSSIYRLRQAELSGANYQSKTLLNNFETYQVSADPENVDQILFDGLNFANNQYRFGSLNPSFATQAEISANMTILDGVTGQLETLIILSE